MENVDFYDLKDDWKEVCDALETPVLVNSSIHSYTKRKRAYWTNSVMPPDFMETHPPKTDASVCMDYGRSPIRHKGEIQTLGKSWKGDPDSPTADTKRPILVKDEAHDELQQLRPHEAELPMGLKSGSTAGRGVTNLQRLTCIGNGWDLHVVKMFIRHLKPKEVMTHAEVMLAIAEGPPRNRDLDEEEIKFSSKKI